MTTRQPASKKPASAGSAARISAKPSAGKPKSKPVAPPTVAARIKPSAAKPGAVAVKRRAKPKRADAATVHEIFARLRAANPEPKGELEYVNAYTLLVAVVLSAQATDAGVNKATRALFAAADTPQKMVALGEDKVRDFIKTIGLFRTKAKNVVALSEQLISRYGGEIPRDRAELETLPGVGRKTANVVLNIAFGEETIAVDTHLFRLSNRLKLAPGKTPLEVELGLEKIIPREFMRHAHHWLILHGRYICKALRPECEKCVIADLCTSGDKRI